MPAVTRVPAVVRANRRFADDKDIRSAHHGWFMSRKDGRAIPYRGVLASKFLELAEAHPGVLRVESKPKPIQWWNGSSWGLYRARYALTCRAGSGTRKVEIEVLTDAELANNEGRWKRIRRAYRQERRTLLTFTQHSILVEPRLTNAIIINSYAGAGIVPTSDEQVLRLTIADIDEFTINGLVAISPLSYPRAYGAVLNSVAAGDLRFFQGRLFDGNTVITRKVRS